jgi:sugar-specific transcriptional regulator TrmB
MNKADIDCLSQLGLTNYEARIYLSLMKRNQLPATEIAQIAKIPRTRVYDDLKSLESKGLCQVVTGKKRLYSAVAPSQLRDTLVNIEEEKIFYKKKKLELKIKQDEETLADKVKNVDNLVGQLIPIYKENQEQDFVFNYVELIKGHYHIANRYKQLFKECKKELLAVVMLKLIGLNEEYMEEIEHQLEFAVDRIKKGLSVKCIYHISPEDEEQNKIMYNIIDKFLEAGEQIKVMENPPMRMAIFDESICMFTMRDETRDPSMYVTQVIKNRMMAKSLKTLWECLWDKAEDYNEHKRRLNID